ncbi:MAG: tyrosine-protein phosphatase [Clostridia bacterium]|nr:tyrosine-protein phosphatase [Clostridia bacterium]
MNRTNETKLSLRILSLLLSLLMLLPLAACGQKTGETTTAELTTAIETVAETTAAETTEQGPKYEIRLNAPASTAIHTDLQATFLSSSDPHAFADILGPAYAAQSVSYDDDPGTLEFGRPNPITLAWTVPEGAAEHVSAYTVRLWTKSDASDAKEIAVASDKTECALYNLFIGTTYKWTVTLLDDEGESVTSSVAAFRTDSQAPRNLCVDGITNVRDLGGWMTLDGGKVRQGLLYRGARLNENDSTDVLITEEGIRTLRDELGIKTEIDLRQTQAVNGRDESGGITVSPLGEGVTYLARPMDYGDALITNAKNKQRVKEVFAVLADESNYPIYFHCAIGTDRTGLIAWLVNGLCGVSEKNLWRDYLFSNFGEIGGTRTRAKNEGVYVNQIKQKDGANLAEKTYNFLKDYFGVPESDLNAVIRILKEAPNAQ